MKTGIYAILQGYFALDERKMGVWAALVGRGFCVLDSLVGNMERGMKKCYSYFNEVWCVSLLLGMFFLPYRIIVRFLRGF
jgi:hypothetical protein